jgi:hypothetical protein
VKATAWVNGELDNKGVADTTPFLYRSTRNAHFTGREVQLAELEEELFVGSADYKGRSYSSRWNR